MRRAPLAAGLLALGCAPAPDPDETRDLAAARPDEAAALRDELRRTLTADREAGRVYPRSVRERLAHREALDALGYFED